MFVKPSVLYQKTEHNWSLRPLSLPQWWRSFLMQIISHTCSKWPLLKVSFFKTFHPCTLFTSSYSRATTHSTAKTSKPMWASTKVVLPLIISCSFIFPIFCETNVYIQSNPVSAPHFTTNNGIKVRLVVNWYSLFLAIFLFINLFKCYMMYKILQLRSWG
jgi:hypothetical protein